MRRLHRRHFWLFLIALGLCACSKGTSERSPETLSVGETPLRRLTRFEYNHTVRDLLGDKTHPADAFQPEKRIQGFDNHANGSTMSNVNVEDFLSAAHDLAQRAVTNSFTALVGCSLSTVTVDCIKTFISQFGKKAFRRPLSTEEQKAYWTLYQSAKDAALSDENPTEVGVEVLLQTMLVSPHFLYHVEVPADATPARVSDWEMASRLSYLIYASMPDDELFRAAGAKELSTAEGVEKQVRRMIQDPKSKAGIEHFLSQWFQIYRIETTQKDSAIWPEFTPAIAASMEKEAQLFFEDIYWTNGKPANLLTASYSFLNKDLSDFYETPGASGETFQKVPFESSKRGGAITLGAFVAGLATNITDPIHRGKVITENLLCQTVPSVPPGVDLRVPAFEDGVSNRDRLEPVTQGNAACQSCHQYMDRIGFGLENFSAIGKWQDHDPNAPSDPIDATGEITFGGAKGSFTGAHQLALRIASSEDYEQCMVQKYMQYTLGRSLSDQDLLTSEAAYTGMKSSQGRIKDMILAVTQSVPFQYKGGSTP